MRPPFMVDDKHCHGGNDGYCETKQSLIGTDWVFRDQQAKHAGFIASGSSQHITGPLQQPRPVRRLQAWGLAALCSGEINFRRTSKILL